MYQKKAYHVYLIYCSAVAFLFSLIFTVSQLYRLEVALLTPFQIVFVGTILELSCFLFEIPTGILADLKSRKLSIIIGLILIGSAFIIEGSMPFFYVIIMTQIVWGIGATFLSGANEAWIADELNGENLENVYLRGAQFGQFFTLLGIATSVTIGYFIINLPMLIGGILFIGLAIYLAIIMEERHFHKTKKDDLNTYQQMVHTFIEGIKFIKTKPILISMVLISLFYGLYSEGFDRLWQPHLKQLGFPTLLKPIFWIGLINLISTISTIVIVEVIKRNLEKKGKLEKVWMLSMINILMIISLIFFALSNQFILAMMMYFSFYIFRVTISPIYRAWMNQQIESSVRATVLSTFGQIDAFGQIIGGPILGIIASSISIEFALLISSIVLLPTVFFYNKTYKRLKKNGL